MNEKIILGLCILILLSGCSEDMETTTMKAEHFRMSFEDMQEPTIESVEIKYHSTLKCSEDICKDEPIKND